MKLQIGEKLKVTVTAVAEFGIFCQWQNHSILVTIPETSWIASYNSCVQFAAVGDTHEIIIRSVDPTGEKISASIRALYSDPWQENSLVIGSIHLAKIVRYVEQADRCNNQPAYLVELMPGAYAMLCVRGQTFQKGDLCEVMITETTPEKRSVKLAMHTINTG